MKRLLPALWIAALVALVVVYALAFLATD